jgi:hypothetical protein
MQTKKVVILSEAKNLSSIAVRAKPKRERFFASLSMTNLGIFAAIHAMGIFWALRKLKHAPLVRQCAERAGDRTNF